jgi:hypothetical protein
LAGGRRTSRKVTHGFHLGSTAATFLRCTGSHDCLSRTFGAAVRPAADAPCAPSQHQRKETATAAVAHGQVETTSVKRTAAGGQLDCRVHKASASPIRAVLRQHFTRWHAFDVRPGESARSARLRGIYRLTHAPARNCWDSGLPTSSVTATYTRVFHHWRMRLAVAE